MTDAIQDKIIEMMRDGAEGNPMSHFESVKRVTTPLEKKYMNAWGLRVMRKHVTPKNWELWMSESAIAVLRVLETEFSVMGLKFDYAAMPDKNDKGHWGFTVSLLKGRLTEEQEKLSKKMLVEQSKYREMSDPLRTLSSRLVDGLVRGKAVCTVDMCFDFDGVIHFHPEHTPNDVVAGEPVQGVMDKLKEYSKKYTIAVFSVRSAILEGRTAMERFIAHHGGQALASKIQYPDHKPIAHWYLDDRGIRIDGPDTFPSSEELEATAIPWCKREKSATLEPANDDYMDGVEDKFLLMDHTFLKRRKEEETAAAVMAEEVIDEGLPEEATPDVEDSCEDS